jgi:hypothetical protein
MSSWAVWRFPLVIKEGLLELDVPAGAELLHVGFLNTEPSLWARVDTEAPKEKLRFHVVLTGRGAPPPENAKHFQSLMPPKARGTVIWHFFVAPRGETGTVAVQGLPEEQS